MDGFGYWSGRDVRVEFRPAPAGSGIVFVRGDLSGCPRIAASVANRTEVPRRTNLCCGGAGVDMVEHVMAALAGLRIDNAEVWVNAQEMPGLDGSSLPLVEALSAAGVLTQDAPRARFVVRRPIRLGTKDCWIEAKPCCSGKTILHYELDYGQPHVVGRQSREIVLTPDSFRSELAPCRTYCWKSEAEALQRQGYGRRVTFRDLLVFDEHGPIDNQLRFADECVRHKLLDLVGDLALAGCDLVGRFSAYRSGHHLNAELLRTVLAQENLEELKRCA